MYNKKNFSCQKPHGGNDSKKVQWQKKTKNNLTKNEVPSAAVQPACQFNLQMEKRSEISQNRCLVFL